MSSTTSTNPFAYPGAITLDTLGDLFAHHRDISNGWSMNDDTGGGGSGGGEPSGGGGAGGGNGEPGGNDTGGQGGSGGQSGGYQPPQTQADLDRIIDNRLARERSKFADYPQLKEKAEAHDAALEAAKTEAERAVDAARKEGASEAAKVANSRLVSAEARALAAELRFREPAKAIRLLELGDVTVSDAGEVDAAALKTKLEQLKTDSPYLVDDGKLPPPRQDRSQGGAGGGGGSDQGVSSGRDMYAAQREKRTKTS